MDDDKKRTLDYRPDIQYTEDFYSAYEGNLISNPDTFEEIDDTDDLFDQDYMDHIQETIDGLAQLIPNLTPELQTAINQVFKPIFNDWYKNLKKKKYPKEIPSDKPQIITPDPWHPGPIPPGIILPPYEPTDPGDDGGTWPPTIPTYDPPTPSIPTIKDPIIGTPGIIIPPSNDGDFFEVDDEFFNPGSPFDIKYPEVDPVEVIELEYVKNLAELYNHYTSQLSKTIGKYYLTLFQSTISSNQYSTTGDTNTYFLDRFSETDAEVKGDANLKHLADAVVRNEINGKNKLCFYTNFFSLESTLYHMKSFKAAYELRLRYEKEQMSASNTQADTMSNRMLTGLREDTNKKYDNAYINLYKYLNSSTAVLDDVLNTNLVSIKAKETLLKKGGTNK
jgi:hypothetical protein